MGSFTNHNEFLHNTDSPVEVDQEDTFHVQEEDELNIEEENDLETQTLGSDKALDVD